MVSRDQIFQALTLLFVLQVTKSWMRAWGRGYLATTDHVGSYPQFVVCCFRLVWGTIVSRARPRFAKRESGLGTFHSSSLRNSICYATVTHDGRDNHYVSLLIQVQVV